MKPFKSFEELVGDFNKISSDFVINNPIFKAHTPKQKHQIAETLSEHIEKVNKYALKLIEVNKLDKIVDSLIIDALSNQHEFINLHELSEFVKCLFARSIIFHDYGKINPNFQVLKMSNKEFFELDNSIKIESQHSALSAFIFIHYHIQETIHKENFNSTERKFLWGMIFLFANPIFYHHSPFFEHKILPFEESVFNSLKRFLNEFKIETKADNLFKPEQLNQIFSSLKNSYQFENYFPIFALLNLNFSILTASDYY